MLSEGELFVLDLFLTIPHKSKKLAPRTPDPDVRKYIEVKPNSPSGRAAAARQIKKYEEATLQKVRALFYDPKKFM
jgi:hypothetical protein